MFLDYSVTYPFKQSADALEKQVDALREFDFSDRLGTITSRTLIVCGDLDRIFSVEDRVGSLSAIAGSKNIVISGAAHAMHAEKDKAFVDCLSEFLGYFEWLCTSLVSTQYKAGVIIIAAAVERSSPNIIAEHSGRHASSAIAKGISPKRVVSVVLTIGRKRSAAPRLADSLTP